MKNNYSNFTIVDDSTVSAVQEPSKTNHDALESIRREQMKQFPPSLVNHNFNEWMQHVSEQVTVNKFGYGTKKTS